jgi:hypothetical protein
MTETALGKLTRKLLALAFLLACFAFVSSHSNTMAGNMKYVCCSVGDDACSRCLDRCGGGPLPINCDGDRPCEDPLPANCDCYLPCSVPCDPSC